MKAVTLLISSFCHCSDVYVAADLLSVRELACHLVWFRVRRSSLGLGRIERTSNVRGWLQ